MLALAVHATGDQPKDFSKTVAAPRPRHLEGHVTPMAHHLGADLAQPLDFDRLNLAGTRAAPLCYYLGIAAPRSVRAVLIGHAQWGLGKPGDGRTGQPIGPGQTGQCLGVAIHEEPDDLIAPDATATVDVHLGNPRGLPGCELCIEAAKAGFDECLEGVMRPLAAIIRHLVADIDDYTLGGCAAWKAQPKARRQRRQHRRDKGIKRFRVAGGDRVRVRRQPDVISEDHRRPELIIGSPDD